MVNKPKLNQPDVEYTTTVTGESITINMTIPTQQFKDIFVTSMSVEDQQSIVDFKHDHVELNHKVYGDIKVEQDIITYNGKVYTVVQPQLTLSDCIEKWEEKHCRVRNYKKQLIIENKNDDLTIY